MSILMEALEEAKEDAPKYTGTPVDILLDADIPAYRAASATDGKFYTVTYGKSVKLSDFRTFKYSKEAHQFADEKALLGYTVDITDDYSPEPLSYATANVDSIICNIIEATEKRYRRPVIVYPFITGKENFRDSVEPMYKSSRAHIRRPTNLKGCKDHLISKWDAEYVEGYEADDLIAIESYARKHKDCVVVSLDKDLLQIPGTHYNFVKREWQLIGPSEARHLFWKQVLTGDKVDDIEGLYGIGPKKSEALLFDLLDRGSNFEYYKEVLKIYMKHIPASKGEGAVCFLSRLIVQVTKTAQLLHLCHKFDDIWQPPVDNDLFPWLDREAYSSEDLCIINWLIRQDDLKKLRDYMATLDSGMTEEKVIEFMEKVTEEVGVQEPEIGLPPSSEFGVDVPYWMEPTIAAAAKKLSAKIDYEILDSFKKEAEGTTSGRKAKVPELTTYERAKEHRDSYLERYEEARKKWRDRK